MLALFDVVGEIAQFIHDLFKQDVAESSPINLQAFYCHTQDLGSDDKWIDVQIDYDILVLFAQLDHVGLLHHGNHWQA